MGKISQFFFTVDEKKADSSFLKKMILYNLRLHMKKGMYKMGDFGLVTIILANIRTSGRGCFNVLFGKSINENKQIRYVY